MMAIKDMAPDEDEFLRVFRIVFATAGKNQFIDQMCIRDRCIGGRKRPV